MPKFIKTYPESLLGIAVAFSVIFALIYPLHTGTPHYVMLLNLYAETHDISTPTWPVSFGYFWPVGYVIIHAFPYMLLGESAIVAVQWLIYLGIIGLAYHILRLYEVGRALATLGALIIALHPYQVFYITRIGDAGLSTLLLLVYVYLLLRLRREENLILWIMIGVVAGLMVSVRTNLILLLVLPFLKRQISLPVGQIIQNYGAFLLAAFGMFSILSLAATGEIFIPKNGPYNFYAGANQHSEQSFWQHRNAEHSIGMGLADYGATLETADNDLFMELATEYIADHPLNFIRLTLIKLYTFFRPDYHYENLWQRPRTEQIEALMHAILALPVLIWIGLSRWVWQRYHLLPRREMGLLIMLYLIPFLVTNSSPRFRIPLDAILIIESIALVQMLIAPPAKTP